MEKPTPPQESGTIGGTYAVNDQPPSYPHDASPGVPRNNISSPPPIGQQQQPIPPQGGYPPQGNYPPQQQSNYNPQAMGCVPLNMLQSQSAPVQCPSCGVRNMTNTTAEAGGFTHAVAALVCFVTCLGCIPYCITSLKDVHHKCSHCGIPLAHFHRSGRTEVLAYPKSR
ncbi:LITAF-like zinc ribbon domain-containing protein [Mariannaea sp. PMI_226]|nr:LITAF-like zinc ribbon domain-containing protein [Mariannaea sp. PMI_226]